MNHPVRILTVAAILGLAAGSSLAQTKPGMASPPAGQAAQAAPAAATPGSEEWLRQRGEAYHSAPESEQDPAEVAATAKLNTQIAERDAAAALLESEQRAEHERAEANYQTDVAEAERARQQWEADKAAAEAAQAEWRRANEVWENMIRACERSGRRDCRAAPVG